MSVGEADLVRAIVAVWDSSGLDAKFTALWKSGVDSADFPVLHEGLAGGEQPLPFCVFEMSAGNTLARMSRDTNDLWEIHDVPVDFQVHANDAEGDSRTAKEIAAYLAEEIMKVFGGHPTTAPEDLTLINGYFLEATKLNDYSMREGEDNYAWVVSYSFRVDVPVTVTAV